MAQKPDLTPPAAVAREAEKGLKLHEAFDRGGTEVGWARARQFRDRRALSRDDVVAMASYFARHEVDKSAKGWGDDKDPSPGYVAWLLWGGEPGRKWAEAKRAELEKAEAKGPD